MLSALSIKNLLKIPLLLLAGSTLLYTDAQNHEQESRESLECIGAQPFCSDQIYTFENAVDTTAPYGPNYGCLSSTDNPIWYYMEIGQSGTIRLKIRQTDQPNGLGRELDVDFTMWGPFESYEDGCRSIMQGVAPIQSSYSGNAVEYAGIGVSGGSNSNCPSGGQSTPAAAQTGEIYIILLTNYSGEAGFITFNQESGTGGANCEIVNPCSITNIDTNANCLGNEIEYSGTITFSDAPDTGTLTVSAENGGSQTFNAPFTSPTNFSFRGNNNEAQNTSITVSFSEDTCVKTKEVSVTNYSNPTFDFNTEICFNSEPIILPTISIDGIVGSWDKSVNTLETDTYTFTPNANQCALPITKRIVIKQQPEILPITSPNQICTGTNWVANLASRNANTTYTWTVESINVTGAQPGSGSTINQLLQTNNPYGGQVVYKIIPYLDGCVGDVYEYAVNVLPKPSAFAPATLEICSNTEATISLSSNYDGIIYNYRVEQNNVTGATSGQGSQIAQTLATINNTTGTATYYITPILNGCEGNEIVVKVIVNPSINIILPDGYLCLDSKGKVTNTLYLSVGNLTGYNFQWYKNQELIIGANSYNYRVLEPGFYYVEALNVATGCLSLSNEVEIKDGATLHRSEIYVENSMENGKATIETIGSGDYVYSLDNGPFLSQNTFTYLTIGQHIIEVRDTNGCYNEKLYFTILTYPNFFTPNGDGINDTWNIWSLKDQADAEILIFDRTGKLLKQITPRGYGWDGTYNNVALPATDYWFIVKYKDGKNNIWKEYKSHFSLKR